MVTNSGVIKKGMHNGQSCEINYSSPTNEWVFQQKFNGQFWTVVVQSFC